MKVYILKLYADEHKANDYCDIGGYFTNKAALVRAMKQHADEIGEIYGGTLEEFVKNDFRHFNSELANIEIISANEWTT